MIMNFILLSEEEERESDTIKHQLFEIQHAAKEAPYKPPPTYGNTVIDFTNLPMIIMVMLDIGG